ncbi:hypothetical protein [Schlesneria paludicola]|uniref:hypothetical protein n=1 Tax=Schlesneria paludicola TaxID=360056 RepID=UPI00029A4867|nr:hypothetical protein [Schlesneria paludicola]
MTGIKHGLMLLVTGLLIGCHQPPTGGPRLPTSPVTGIVFVDGNPAEMVEVTCQSDGESSAIKYPLTTTTDKDGKFSLTTYQTGDGLPEGTYVLAFKWLEPSLVPVDKFKGAYADLKKSTFKVTVIKGQKCDAGTIELSSKGPGK